MVAAERKETPKRSGRAMKRFWQRWMLCRRGLCRHERDSRQYEHLLNQLIGRVNHLVATNHGLVDRVLELEAIVEGFQNERVEILRLAGWAGRGDSHLVGCLRNEELRFDFPVFVLQGEDIAMEDQIDDEEDAIIDVVNVDGNHTPGMQEIVEQDRDYCLVFEDDDEEICEQSEPIPPEPVDLPCSSGAVNGDNGTSVFDEQPAQKEEDDESGEVQQAAGKFKKYRKAGAPNSRHRKNKKRGTIDLETENIIGDNVEQKEQINSSERGSKFSRAARNAVKTYRAPHLPEIEPTANDLQRKRKLDYAKRVQKANETRRRKAAEKQRRENQIAAGGNDTGDSMGTGTVAEQSNDQLDNDSLL